MKKILQIIILIAVFLLPLHAWSLDVIPGLKVFGGDTRAAYGNGENPTICIVDDLTNNNGALADGTRNGVAVKLGSFRECVNYNVDNKLIIFEVSGVIEHFGKYDIDNDYITIAGQTAPSPGVSLHGAMLNITGSHILIQHLRVRVGDNPTGVDPDYRNSLEGFGSYTVIDHCSFSWATDTNVGTSGTSHWAFSNCIISEPLYDSMHSKGAHGLALNITNEARYISIINNLIAHSDFRNPNLSGHGSKQQVLVANNVLYNPGLYGIFMEESSGVHDYNIVGNNTIGGDNSSSHAEAYTVDLIRTQNANTDIFIDDNRVETKTGATNTQTVPGDWDRVRYVDPQAETDNKSILKTFAYPTGYIPMDIADVKAYVLQNVGARPTNRDEVDTRIISDVKNGTGSFVDTIEYTNADCTGNNQGPGGIYLGCCTGARAGNCDQNDEGGWPALTANIRRADSIIGFPTDPHADNDGDGYTNLEEWLHELSMDLIGDSGQSDSDPLAPPNGLRIVSF